jgi:hypothetical protein
MILGPVPSARATGSAAIISGTARFSSTEYKWSFFVRLQQSDHVHYQLLKGGFSFLVQIFVNDRTNKMKITLTKKLRAG